MLRINFLLFRQFNLAVSLYFIFLIFYVIGDNEQNASYNFKDAQTNSIDPYTTDESICVLDFSTVVCFDFRLIITATIDIVREAVCSQLVVFHSALHPKSVEEYYNSTNESRHDRKSWVIQEDKLEVSHGVCTLFVSCLQREHFTLKSACCAR